MEQLYLCDTICDLNRRIRPKITFSFVEIQYKMVFRKTFVFGLSFAFSLLLDRQYSSRFMHQRDQHLLRFWLNIQKFFLSVIVLRIHLTKLYPLDRSINHRRLFTTPSTSLALFYQGKSFFQGNITFFCLRIHRTAKRKHTI